MEHRLPATLDMAREFSQLFVNRRAYTIQSVRPHPESGRHYYYRPKPRDGAEPAELTGETVRRHLAGEITIGIYAINAATQRCKWMAIDADYKTALEDLIKVQRQLQNDRIEAALEKSKRGGHLWILFERPVLARDARTYIYHVAGKLEVQVKGTGLADGIEIFPKQDEVRREEFGNAIRAPLGVHWGARESRGWRYWYYGADYTLEDQLAYLKGLRKVKEEHLQRMIAGKTIPPEFVQHARRTESPKYFESKPGEFRILEHVEVKRQAGRNWVTRCPSCAAQGHDKSGDNLAISVEEPRKYCCWAGCTREMIRAAVGGPSPGGGWRDRHGPDPSRQFARSALGLDRCVRVATCCVQPSLCLAGLGGVVSGVSALTVGGYGNHRSRRRVLDVTSKGKEYQRCRIRNSRKEETREPGSPPS